MEHGGQKLKERIAQRAKSIGNETKGAGQGARIKAKWEAGNYKPSPMMVS